MKNRGYLLKGDAAFKGAPPYKPPNTLCCYQTYMPPFDATAAGYDAEFTHTQTGKYQRLQVWNVLLRLGLSHKKILEMNCGTGEDALFLAKEKASVTATDISQEMLTVAKQKANNQSIDFVQWDLRQDFPFIPEEKYDIAFSNFGGLNCLSSAEIEGLGKKLSAILAEKGQLVLVIMPSFCVWESLYFLAKGKLKTAFRRRDKAGVLARLNENQSVLTYYYSPKSLENLLKPHFFVAKKAPIGFFLPPSYLDNFFKKVPFLLPVLYFLEKCVAGIPFLAYFSDHYVMVFSRRFPQI